MFIRKSIWHRIRSEFSVQERVAIDAAVTGEYICPPGLSVDTTKLVPELAMRLRDAMTRVAPGA
ncbi:hypothetical protein DYQ86_15905 [Acidobacteria bacterium AB60]|nr:hypothetical protein DYQ86_15905 [Acidobacteria bacterium AB60]